jgi:hypothetical protein
MNAWEEVAGGWRDKVEAAVENLHSLQPDFVIHPGESLTSVEGFSLAIEA